MTYVIYLVCENGSIFADEKRTDFKRSGRIERPLEKTTELTEGAL